MNNESVGKRSRLHHPSASEGMDIGSKAIDDLYSELGSCPDGLTS